MGGYGRPLRIYIPALLGNRSAPSPTSFSPATFLSTQEASLSSPWVETSIGGLAKPSPAPVVRGDPGPLGRP
jgi:hypothetical protein